MNSNSFFYVFVATIISVSLTSFDIIKEETDIKSLIEPLKRLV